MALPSWNNLDLYFDVCTYYRINFRAYYMWNIYFCYSKAWRHFFLSQLKVVCIGRENYTGVTSLRDCKMPCPGNLSLELLSHEPLPSTVPNLRDIEMVPDTNKTPCVGHLLSPCDYCNLWDLVSLLSSSLSCQKRFCHNEQLKITRSFSFQT